MQMSRLDHLPPAGHAALSLVLHQGKSYAEVAALLGIPERAVHDRAHAALAVLAPREARVLPADRRADIGDYLLGQQTSIGERLQTRTYLEGSPPARAWAQAISEELAPLAAAPLPEISPGSSPTSAANGLGVMGAPAAPSSVPAPAAASGAPASGAPADAAPSAAPASGAPADTAPAGMAAAASGATAPAVDGGVESQAARSLPSSRVGGALLLGLIVVAVIVAVVLTTGGGGTHSGTSASGSTGKAASAGKTSSSPTGPTEDKRLSLTSPDPSSKAVGAAEVLSEGSKYAYYLVATHLPPTKGFFYAVWLYNSSTSHEPVSRAPAVGSDGKLQGGALLPGNAGKYHTMLVTRETSERATHPGPVALKGAFALH